MSAYQPLVSIIVTSYNYADYVGLAIESAIHQSYQHKEIIVVDDGSTDHSRDIIKQYVSRIKFIAKNNGGQASAFNAGFAASKGDIIFFLDSDDMLAMNAVEEVVSSFQDPEVAKVHWWLVEIDGQNKQTKKSVPSLQLSEGSLREEVISYGPLQGGGPPHSPPTSGNAWSRKFLSQVMPVPEAEYVTCTDQYLHYLAPVYGKIKRIEKPLGSYRVHGNNYSLNPVEGYMQEFLQRFEQSCNIVSQHLLNQGVAVDTSRWQRDSWFHKIHASLRDILMIVPEGNTFILADANEWGIQRHFSGRRRLHFMDRDGSYWGPPGNDRGAISEITSSIQKGASFIFFTWTTAWYLHHYAGMNEFLKSSFPVVLENSRLIAFQLIP